MYGSPAPAYLGTMDHTQSSGSLETLRERPVHTNMNGCEPLSTAILVGGQSRRMGTNKALLTLAPSGPTVIELVVCAVRQVTDDIALVGPHPDRVAYPDLPWVTDETSGAGPLAGIQAALTHARHESVLVVACDMPFLNPALLRYMISQPRDYDILVPEIDQRLQPLHAIYRRSCLPIIGRFLDRGENRVQGWFPEAKVMVIPEPIVARHDPSLRSCLNLNTPADLALARRILTDSPSACSDTHNR